MENVLTKTYYVRVNGEWVTPTSVTRYIKYDDEWRKEEV